MFCDELKVKVIAGKGGNGCVSFRREKFVPKGGPDGGDGGRGGSIVLKVNPHLNTLSHLTNGKVYKATKGENGMGKNMTGRSADPLILEVPQGTIVYDDNSREFVADLSKKDEEIVVAKGGKGGLGNAHFVSSVHQIPRFAEMGENGEEKNLYLELKLVADVGIIGLPSAGKSSLIAAISNARPKIANYPFTTLVPNLGVINLKQFGGSDKETFVVTDIPGLIEGASEGKGLGHQFLKHISRNNILVHLIDGSLEDIEKNYKIINTELKKFDKNLAKKEQILVINKIDIIPPEKLQQKIKSLKKISKVKEIFTISAAAHQGLKELVFAMYKELKELKKKTKPVEIKTVTILKPHLEKVKYEIDKIIKKKDHKIFRLKGARIEQLLQMTDTNNPEGLERIYHYFKRMGIQQDIETHGATFGDIIRINDKNIPYRK